MSLEIIIKDEGLVRVLSCKGSITLGYGAQFFRDTIKECVWREKRILVVDMGEVAYMDSSGFGELISAFTTVTSAGGRLALCNLSRKVLDLLQATKMHAVFEVFETPQQACKSLSGN